MSDAIESADTFSALLMDGWGGGFRAEDFPEVRDRIAQRDAAIRADERARMIVRLDEIATTAVPPTDLFCHGWIKSLDMLRAWLATERDEPSRSGGAGEGE